MQVKDKVVVVTGGASGIGKSLCLRFAKEGARAVVVSDIDADGVAATCSEMDSAAQSLAVVTDVGREEQVAQLAQQTLAEFGQIDLFCSNAGIFTAGNENVPTDAWQRIWDINVMAHIFAARAALPHMLERGEGYLLNTASAAGLLSQVGSAPYSVTDRKSVV